MNNQDAQLINSSKPNWENLLPIISQSLILMREVTDVLKLLQKSAAPVIGFDQINLILPHPQTRQPCLYYISRSSNNVETLQANEFSSTPGSPDFQYAKNAALRRHGLP